MKKLLTLAALYNSNENSRSHEIGRGETIAIVPANDFDKVVCPGCVGRRDKGG